MLEQRVVPRRRINLSPLWSTEDWWTVWLGGLVLLLAVGGILRSIPRLPSWTENISQALPLDVLPGVIIFGASIALLTGIALSLMNKDVKGYLLGFPFVFAVAVVATVLGNQSTLSHYGFSKVIWALVLGLAFSNVVGKPKWLVPALRTELFIKTGLVLLGAEILFNRVLTLGAYGLGVAWIVTPVVLFFMYLYGTRVLKIKSKSMVATVAACTSVCGVSAAIAAGAATRAKKEEISFAISVSLIFTILMMLALPFLINLFGLGELVGGAWIGGTVDSTGAVVVAGSMVGNEAMEVAAVIKMLQNVMIGLVAFVLATLWVTKIERGHNMPRPGLSEIWVRFPKFILGFIVASLIFSFVLIPWLGEQQVDNVLGVTSSVRGWLFVLAFVSIGLDSKLKDMAKVCKGKGPVKLYIVGQSFNLVLTLIAAWVFFSGRFFGGL